MKQEIKVIKDQLNSILNLLDRKIIDVNLIADYTKQCQIDLQKIDSQYNVSGCVWVVAGVHNGTIHGMFTNREKAISFIDDSESLHTYKLYIS